MPEAVNGFVNAKHVERIAAVVADNLPYLAKSRSGLSQEQLKGKKFGTTYNLYLSPLATVRKGTDAEPESLKEIETPVHTEDVHMAFELGVWDKQWNIGDFESEIAVPNGQSLAANLQKDVVDSTVFTAAQAVIGDASFATLSNAASALEEVSVTGNLVSFIKPTIQGKISATGLARFLPTDTQAEIYGRNYLGEYAGASQVGLKELPEITTPTSDGMAATITATPSDSGDYFEEIREISGAGIVKGLAYTAEALDSDGGSLGNVKIVDRAGLATDQDWVVIAQNKANAAGKAKIPYLRIAIQKEDADGNLYVPKGESNPNAWVPAGAASFRLTPILDASTKYAIGQVREESALVFDSYKFNDLPGSENSVKTVGGVTVKMSRYGDGQCLNEMVRIDAPYAAALPVARDAVVVYFKKG
jgi:hypothetical protein